MKMTDEQMTALVNRFLQWPVPASCCPDGTPGQPGRIGTNLLSADEARQMLTYVLNAVVGSTCSKCHGYGGIKDPVFNCTVHCDLCGGVGFLHASSTAASGVEEVPRG